jgi:hypothetical protein
MHAANKPTSALRRRARRVVLFALRTKPPWWGSAGLWVGVGMILMLAAMLSWSLMVFNTRIASYPFSFAQQADGSWQFNAQGPGPCLMFMTNCIYSEIPGAIRCDCMVGVYVADGGPYPPGGLTVDDVKALRVRGSQQILQDMSPALVGTSEADHRMARNLLGGIISGRRNYSAGPLVSARPYLLALGLLFFIPGAIVGNTRYYLRLGYKRRLELGIKGICPRCKYSLAGLETPTCPECGLDLPTDAEESRRGIF